MRGLFLSGTGTDIGKTYVSAAIAHMLSKKGLNIGYYKACASGAKTIEESDAGYVRLHGNINQKTDTLLSYLYEKPLSPHLAGRGEGRFVSLDKIVENFNALRAHFDYVLSEGAGGIVCPVVYEKDCHLFYEDIVRALNLPVVVASDAGLGTINHTVLTVSYLKSHNFSVKGVILNRFEKDNPMHEDNLYMIEELTHNKVIATLGKGESMLTLRDKSMEEYFDEC